MSGVEEEANLEAEITRTLSPKVWCWRIAKWTLCLVVVAFVVQRGRSLWQQGQLDDVSFQPFWLVLSLLVYWIGWIPSVWFWHRLLLLHGETPALPMTTRAYFCGHLGKYIPGKATVLVIRAGLLKEHGYRAGLAALTAAYETLLAMGVGLAIAVALSPWLLSDATIATLPTWIAWGYQRPIVPALFVGVGCLLLLPILSSLLTRIGRKMAPRETGESEGQNATEPVQIPIRFLALGFLAFTLGWTLHGLSLGLVLQSLSDAPLDLRAWAIWTGAVSLATSVGFLAIFAPGGVGVREGLLIESLTQQTNILTTQAIIAAVLLRFVWLVAEILAAIVLYYGLRNKNSQKLPDSPS